MRKLIISEWLTLDGIFDAGTMEQWFMPFDSKQRQEYIINTMADCGGILFGRTTFEELGAYWAPQATPYCTASIRLLPFDRR